MSIRPYRDIDRRVCRTIHVGKVPVGGDAPITVQSMTNTVTSDIKATVEQVQALERAGADIVRVSCPDQESALALKHIVRQVEVPIVADADLVKMNDIVMSDLPRIPLARVFFDVAMQESRALGRRGARQLRDYRANANEHLDQAFDQELGYDFMRRVGINLQFSAENPHGRKRIAGPHLERCPLHIDEPRAQLAVVIGKQSGDRHLDLTHDVF